MMGYQRNVLRTVFLVSSCVILWATYNLSKDSSTNTVVEPQKVTLPKVTVSQSNVTVREEMFRRKEWVNQMCKTLNHYSSNITGSIERYIIYTPKNLMYCYVAKAGCTYWKKVFLTLQHSNNNKSRWTHFLRNAHRSSVHRLKIDTLQTLSMEKVKDYLTLSRKFLFVRDPYSRLYSAYIDKFVLGDFWNSYGKIIIKEIRQNPSSVSEDCGHDVTFDEFLKYVVLHSASPSSNGGAEHWFPVSKLCHPCSVDFDLIGKQESFSEDRDFILSEFKLSDLLLPLEETSLEDASLSSMAQSAVLLWYRTARSPMACQTYSVKRDGLLKGFGYQGYLSENSTYTWPAVNETLREFIMWTRLLFRKQNLQAKEFHERKKQAMVSAYKNVSLSLLYKIKETFQMDFLLFGYDPVPNEIFKNR